MHAVEQAVAKQFVGGRAEKRFSGGRSKQYRAVRTVARNDVRHVARQQAIAVFFRVEQPEAHARKRLGAHGDAGGIQRGGNNAERGKRAVVLFGADCWQQFKRMAEHQKAGSAQRQGRGRRHHAARGRQRGFKRNDHQPDRGK